MQRSEQAVEQCTTTFNFGPARRGAEVPIKLARIALRSRIRKYEHRHGQEMQFRRVLLQFRNLGGGPIIRRRTAQQLAHRTQQTH